MKHLFKFFIFCATISFTSCVKQEFYGDTFLTVEGTIINVNELPIQNFKLQVLGVKSESAFILFGSAESRIVVAESQTNNQGRFRITFPDNNGKFVLKVAQGFLVVLPSGGNPNFYNLDLLAIDKAQMIDYRRDLGIIKVRN